MNISQRVTPNAQTSLAVVNLPCEQKGCCKPRLLTAHIQQKTFQSTPSAAKHKDAEFITGKMLWKRDSRAGDLLSATHKGTKVWHGCFVGQEQHVCETHGTALRRYSFHWGKRLETGSKPQRKPETTVPPEKVCICSSRKMDCDGGGQIAAAYLHPKHSSAAQKSLWTGSKALRLKAELKQTPDY